MKTKPLVGGIILAAGLLTGCGPSGSGDIVTETRQASEFDRIEVSDGINVNLTVDPTASPSITSVYDDNLQERIVTEVDGDTLLIRSSGSFNAPGSDRAIEVTMATLADLVADGGGRITGTGVSEQVTVEADGGANVDLSDLIVDDMELHAGGGSRLTVTVRVAIDGEVSGGANLVLGGNPAIENIAVSGGGSVTH